MGTHSTLKLTIKERVAGNRRGEGSRVRVGAAPGKAGHSLRP